MTVTDTSGNLYTRAVGPTTSGSTFTQSMYYARNIAAAGIMLATPDGHVAQRSITTTGQRAILTALQLPEPPRFFDFTPVTSDNTP